LKKALSITILALLLLSFAPTYTSGSVEKSESKFRLISPSGSWTSDEPILYWEPIQGDFDLDHYEVWLDGVKIAETNSTSYQLSNLTPGTHQWYITAIDKRCWYSSDPAWGVFR